MMDRDRSTPSYHLSTNCIPSSRREPGIYMQQATSRKFFTDEVQEFDSMGMPNEKVT